ncbi:MULTISPECIES: HNH endonuclease signature motif containing protein [unclassified Mycolicibacterium]|uniref:HNH endonuclease signature motif containing protein n=1 Tax=unclassified Mycolicibacterium TaxID=2636767 RepID=UPI0012DE7097|nr:MULTISPECIES: HNH endonuclease signature motif containing protein [unclassified Mycolicibacterium]MUL85890.1 HNH endonuclease [Mycolicibacterium sp. CBMA 329]MUL91658.1 HNH endonuclease [Mycolicibacterium sp. CBMA 331]MUM03111.1 HNH endonuclease [Mycolicibacterium sp. CBMA 334]MUM27739.1 HNH endonuclease [Mycolicibacterium sp. CBMA 295]MUM41953.1 HNH endonuclease [Mycolicibacterium sp. CBMA 247]
MEDRVGSKLAALAAAVADLRELSFTSLSTEQLLDVCAGLQEARNLIPTVEHPAVAVLAEQVTSARIGAKSWPEALRIRLRISADEARRRYRDALNLGPRVSVSGEPLAPRRAATAAAQAGGWVTQEHIEILESFFKRCPVWVDTARRTRFEEKLVAVAAGNAPETLRQTVNEALYLLNQDGPEPADAQCQRRRGITLGPQDADGMSRLQGWVNPELRAGLDAVLAKQAAPGMCNPDDETPCVSGTPSQEAIDADTRCPAKRNHDALLALTRNTLMSGELGQHNGLPVSIVVTTTLQELEAGAGVAVTTSGSKLSIPDVIRLAAHAHHYLAVFDKHSTVPLYLGRTRRLATPGQRLMLFARDRGCTRPGCTASGNRCQAHHAQKDFAQGGQTNINELALGCGPDQRLVGPGKWTTRINAHGRCEWIPPPLLDTGQARTNGHHHPQHYLTETEGGDDGETDCQ